MTLAEILITVVIMGIGMVALMGAIQSGAKIKSDESLRTQAVLLAQELREWTLRLDWNDLENEVTALSGVTPHDSAGQAMSGLTGWTETATLSWRAEDDPAEAEGSETSVAYVEVLLAYQGQEVLTTGWLVTQKEE
jgi:Tfp pilus assembly protein PilV